MYQKLGQHRTIASSRFGGSFPPILRFEKFEIHTVFLHISTRDLRKNRLPNQLAELRGAALVICKNPQRLGGFLQTQLSESVKIRLQERKNMLYYT